MTEKVEPEPQAAVAQPQTTEEAHPAADEQQPPKPEQEKKEAEAGKEKKPRTPRARKPRQPKVASHPPYFQMIEEAILALNEKNGSSPYAIAKFMEENHKSVLPVNFRKILALQIKNSVSRGKLTKVRASYKLPEASKKETTNSGNGGRDRAAKTRSTSKAEAEKKPKEVRPKTVTTKKKAPGVKKPGKSGAAAAAKPKQPRSIKSSGAKRMKVVSSV